MPESDTLQTLLPIIVFTPFVATAMALFTGKYLGLRTGWYMILSAGICFFSLLYITCKGFFASEHHEAIIFTSTWVEFAELEINLAFLADGFGLFFAMLVSGIGLLVGIYSLNYIPQLPNSRVGRYYASLIAFMGAMLGVTLSDDLMLLFVFWEITSISSFMLIGFWYDSAESRHGALTALLLTGLGGLSMMVGFVLMGVEFDTFTISKLAEATAGHENSPIMIAAFILILGGAFTKSAQVPFHFWLPGAMVAPTPVSCYLHSATMVKAGIYLMGRVLPIFIACSLWSPVMTTFGFLTFALGAYQSFFETDLKGILARTTLSTLGLVMMLYGLSAADQDVLQLMNHAVYKAGLFLVAGIIEHATHTRDLRRLGGLKKYMPITFIACILLCLSMAGLPPFFGFLAKENLYAMLLNVWGHTPLTYPLIGIAVLSNAFIFAVGFKLIIGIFCGKVPEELHDIHAPGFWLAFSPVVLALAAIGFGLAYPVTGYIVNGLSSNTHAHLHIGLLPDPDHMGPFYLSLLTVVTGIVLYRARVPVAAFQRKINVITPMQKVWDAFIATITAGAVAYSQWWQNGSLRWYFSIVIAFCCGLSLWVLARYELFNGQFVIDPQSWHWPGMFLVTLLAVAVFTVARARTRLGAAIALSATGFLVALTFVIYRSPDILLTQILIEMVSTIFILLVLFFMPTFRKDAVSPGRQSWNLLISVVAGFTVFIFVLLCTSPQFLNKNKIAFDYLQRALGDAGGANAVNVIIVDFRAIDTSGEITVLVVVGLCVFGLLRARRASS